MQLNLKIKEDCVECNFLKPKIEALEKYILKVEERLELKDMAYYTNNTAPTVQSEYLEKICNSKYIRYLLKQNLPKQNVINVSMLEEMLQEVKHVHSCDVCCDREFKRHNGKEF